MNALALQISKRIENLLYFDKASSGCHCKVFLIAYVYKDNKETTSKQPAIRNSRQKNPDLDVFR